MKSYATIRNHILQDEEFLITFNKIKKITFELENNIVNRNPLINWIFSSFALSIFPYREDLLDELFHSLNEISREDIFYNEEFNKLIHVPWVWWGVSRYFKTIKSAAFYKWITDAIYPLIDARQQLNYLIKNKKKLNALIKDEKS